MVRVFCSETGKLYVNRKQFSSFCITRIVSFSTSTSHFEDYKNTIIQLLAVPLNRCFNVMKTEPLQFCFYVYYLQQVCHNCHNSTLL